MSDSDPYGGVSSPNGPNSTYTIGEVKAAEAHIAWLSNGESKGMTEFQNRNRALNYRVREVVSLIQCRTDAHKAIEDAAKLRAGAEGKTGMQAEEELDRAKNLDALVTEAKRKLAETNIPFDLQPESPNVDSRNRDRD